MNTDIIQGEWNQVRGEVQRQWGKLTNDQLDMIEGSRTKLLGALQETYGVVRDDAEKQLRDWETGRAA